MNALRRAGRPDRSWAEYSKWAAAVMVAGVLTLCMAWWLGWWSVPVQLLTTNQWGVETALSTSPKPIEPDPGRSFTATIASGGSFNGHFLLKQISRKPHQFQSVVLQDWRQVPASWNSQACRVLQVGLNPGQTRWWHLETSETVRSTAQLVVLTFWDTSRHDTSPAFRRDTEFFIASERMTLRVPDRPAPAHPPSAGWHVDSFNDRNSADIVLQRSGPLGKAWYTERVGASRTTRCTLYVSNEATTPLPFVAMILIDGLQAPMDRASRFASYFTASARSWVALDLYVEIPVERGLHEMQAVVADYPDKALAGPQDIAYTRVRSSARVAVSRP